MSQNFKLRLIAKTAALILSIIGFALPAQSQQPEQIIVSSFNTGLRYDALIVGQIEGQETSQILYQYGDGANYDVDPARGEEGYRGPIYQLVLVDGEGNETYTDTYYIVPLIGRPVRR